MRMTCWVYDFMLLHPLTHHPRSADHHLGCREPSVDGDRRCHRLLFHFWGISDIISIRGCSFFRVAAVKNSGCGDALFKNMGCSSR